MSNPEFSFIFFHGFLGRAETRIAGRTFEYFRGLWAIAEEFNIELAVPQMPGRTGVADRADIASQAIAQMQASKIVLVGNSMGGLVARTLAYEFDPAHRIKSVITIATPHRGSPLADSALKGKNGMPEFIVDLFKDAVHDLSIFNADAFNMATPNCADVDYYSWAFARDVNEMSMLLKSRAKEIFEIEGPNDGRRGGATELFRQTNSMQAVAFRGRWSNFQTAKIYTDSALADRAQMLVPNRQLQEAARMKLRDVLSHMRLPEGRQATDG